MKQFFLVVFFYTVTFSAQAALHIETWQTKQGANVVFAQANQLPMVDIRMVFDAGSARDGAQKGVAYLTNDLIGMGDDQLDEEAFSSQMEGLGAQVSSQSLKDMAIVSIRSLNKPEMLQKVVEKTARAIAKPSFPEAVLAREKKLLLTSLQAKQQSPSTLASEAFWKKLYANHPYASPAEGEVETVQSMTRAQLVAFHQRYYVAKNATIAIVGQLDRAQAEQIAEQLTMDLAVGEAAEDLPQAQQPEPGLTEIDYPSTQTQLIMGQLGVSRSDPDYVALYLANHILGGSGFASHLMEEVREKRGLVYGVGSALVPMRATGPWYVSLKTANANRDEALKVTQQTIMQMLASISQADIDAHKDNIIGGFALETDSNKDIVGYLAMMGFYHLPLNWLDSFPAKIKAIDRNTLMQVVRAHLQPEKWTGVVLGKKVAAGTPVQSIPMAPAGGHHD